MKIEYLGHSAFRLVSSGGTRIVTDPYGDVGFGFPQVAADGVTVSHAHFDHDNVSAVGGSFAVFSKAGSFSLGDFSISAIERFHDDVGGRKRGKDLVFFFEADGMRICHLGDLGEKFSKELCDLIKPVDVLLIPVGGNYTIDGRCAKRMIDEISPGIAIPMHYYVEGLTVDIAPPDEFLAQFPAYERACGEIEIQKSDIKNKTKIIFLERSSK